MCKTRRGTGHGKHLLPGQTEQKSIDIASEQTVAVILGLSSKLSVQEPLRDLFYIHSNSLNASKIELSPEKPLIETPGENIQLSRVYYRLQCKRVKARKQMWEVNSQVLSDRKPPLETPSITNNDTTI